MPHAPNGPRLEDRVSKTGLELISIFISAAALLVASATTYLTLFHHRDRASLTVASITDHGTHYEVLAFVTNVGNKPLVLSDCTLTVGIEPKHDIPVAKLGPLSGDSKLPLFVEPDKVVALRGAITTNELRSQVGSLAGAKPLGARREIYTVGVRSTVLYSSGETHHAASFDWGVSISDRNRAVSQNPHARVVRFGPERPAFPG